jgi:hypothetical protein
LNAVVKPIMNKYGFGMTYYPGFEDGKPVLYGELLHCDGHSKRGHLPLVPDRGPGRNDLQAEGSGLSYQKRYLMELMLNIVRKGVDDDGIKGGLMPITEAQLRELSDLLLDTNTKPEMFLRLFVTGIENMRDIPTREFPRLKNALLEKRGAMQKKDQKQEKKK